MKKYKRKVSTLPRTVNTVLLIISIALAIATAITFFFANDFSMFFGVYCLCCLSVYLGITLSVVHRCSYNDTYIQLFYGPIKYKKIKYSDFSYICISNASYNNYVYNSNYSMQYSIKKKKGTDKVTFPFISLHKPKYPIQEIKSAMYSKDLYLNDGLSDYKNIFCLGICWFDSLVELLEHTDIPVYVLEDVYLRFKGCFDTVFKPYEGNMERFYIVTEHQIEYLKYLRGERK